MAYRLPVGRCGGSSVTMDSVSVPTTGKRPRTIFPWGDRPTISSVRSFPASNPL
ncbi:MAG: hypothetical protein LKE39_03275 [Sphaerochaeta sp.]|nr:hypothetical protein [Sphaerochaeta sp.]